MKQRTLRLAAAIAIVLIALGFWWFFRGGDHRFIGKWKVANDNRPDAAPMELTFERDGKASCQEGGQTVDFHEWDTHGGRLNLYGAWGDVTEFRIKDIGEQIIRLEMIDPAAPQPMTLSRLPE